MTIEMAFNIAISLIAALGGIWLRSLQEELKNNRSELASIRNEYQRREDALRDNQIMTGLMQDIKRSIERIDGKLDRKADK
ncbi:hypothetical protein BMF90_07500 [Serratia sp. OLHL2]|uniref:hypothetical protein n=1 Tax=Serratia TaxID=613 RepID=UPI000C13695C|nr:MULTISPECIES: hypothetical protein [Serratia]PHY80437.1 hypothetical protein CS371_24840 [Serratia marcescens]PII53758.1 hypothetical protein BMF87_08745 [Serratia sp. OLEL1]PII57840.1 hypothetical protein BMF85_12925 [Serratia sp. OLCL1]PII65087.1 hypothetical protein BMF92_06645 [Serratia sp. OLBL1]PII65583.1 hypothetical protein BMF90_07500 [Serratia sp. OLHL2]